MPSIDADMDYDAVTSRAESLRTMQFVTLSNSQKNDQYPFTLS